MLTYRSPEGYRFGCRDRLDAKVLWEIWVENVYRTTPAQFDKSKVCVDIGANIGAFSLYAVARGARRVVAFEPESGNFARLTEHANAQDWPIDLTRFHDQPLPVEPVNLAVGGAAGEVCIEDNGRDSRVMPLVAGLQTVRMVTLEQAFADNGVAECGVLKVDIEGSEYALFDAAPVAIIRRCAFIAIETHASDERTYGALVAKLASTHRVETLGRHDVDGGYLYCMRY